MSNDPAAWGLIDRTLPTIEANLALDEALLIACEDLGAGPTLRFWESPYRAVVLGASSRRFDDVEIEHCEADGVVLSRRSSGGGTVLLGPGVLCVTVVLPVGADARYAAVDEAQVAVLGEVADALASPELPVVVQGSGDLTLRGRKFAGSAQRRLRKFFMVHASLLVDFPLDLISRYLKTPKRQPAYRVGRSHGEFVCNLPVGRPAVVGALSDAWRRRAGGGPLTAGSGLDELVNELVGSKFGDPAWVNRL